jgi:transposase InsO family protein
VKFAFIRVEKAQYPIGALCRVLGVSRSGYHAWARRQPSKRAREDAALGVEIAEVHAQSRRAYGSPRVHAELRARGRRVGAKRVARLMRERDLRSKRRRRFKATTDSKHSLPVAPNVVQRNFKVDAPDKVWVGDITYLWTGEGWLYLAVILDLFSRAVVGWATSERLDRQLALDALEMALGRRDVRRGLVHHTDRGCQYASGDYRARLDARGITCSMSRKGDCWDNAVAESFFATLKTELDAEDLETRAKARSSLFSFIEVFYNRQRRHSFLGYATPEQIEKMFVQIKKAA